MLVEMKKTCHAVQNCCLVIIIWEQTLGILSERGRNECDYWERSVALFSEGTVLPHGMVALARAHVSAKIKSHRTA